MQTATVLSFFSSPALFSRSPIFGGSLTLYTSFQSILTLQLLIMQVITRVLVPSATFPNPLWVAATKAALFRGHFLINVARTLVGCIQCRGDNFSLDYFCTIRLWVSYCTYPSPGSALGGCLCRCVLWNFKILANVRTVSKYSWTRTRSNPQGLVWT